MFRIDVLGPPGALASDPERALQALTKAAAADGANPDAWLEKAVRAAAESYSPDARYQVVADAVAELLTLYKRALVLAREAIRERLEQAAREVDLGEYRALADRSKLRKASKKPTRLITPNVIADVARIIREHHGGIAAALFGRDGVPEADWKLAVALGLVPEDADPKGIAGGLYVYGAMLAHLDQAAETARYGTTLAEFRDHIAKHPIPQTDLEHRAAQYVAHRGAQAIVGLGNRAGATIGSKLIEADKAQDAYLRGVIRDVISAKFGDDEAAKRIRELGADQGLPDDFFEDRFRSTIRGIVSDIGHATSDWARDIQRIAQTETTAAVQEGQVEAWTEQEEEKAAGEGRPPDRLRVFKVPRPGACKHCLRLHVDDASNPRIYFMDEVVGNGTNVGKKAADWLIVAGPTHPWCGCSLHRVPAMLAMPDGWRSGDSAPTLIGPGGRIV